MPPTVTLSGFQIMQLLAVADHKADAVVAITQDGGHTHARLLDHSTSTAVYLPITGREAADLAQAQDRRRRRACGVEPAWRGPAVKLVPVPLNPSEMAALRAAVGAPFEARAERVHIYGMDFYVPMSPPLPEQKPFVVGAPPRIKLVCEHCTLFERPSTDRAVFMVEMARLRARAGKSWFNRYLAAWYEANARAKPHPKAPDILVWYDEVAQMDPRLFKEL